MIFMIQYECLLKKVVSRKTEKVHVIEHEDTCRLRESWIKLL